MALDGAKSSSASEFTKSCHWSTAIFRPSGFLAFPGPVRTKLEDSFQANVLRNTLFGGELERILSLLGDTGVPVIPLKGTSSAESLYGDLALSVCADIDSSSRRNPWLKLSTSCGPLDDEGGLYSAGSIGALRQGRTGPARLR